MIIKIIYKRVSLKLYDMKVGFHCKILEITATKLLKYKFMDFGIKTGTELIIKNISLSKSNMTVEIKNYTVALRDDEAHLIQVIQI